MSRISVFTLPAFSLPVFLLLISLLLVSPRSLSAQSPPLNFASVDSLLQDSISVIGGGAALMVVQNGRTVYKKSFGSYLTPDTLLPIASATKWLSAGVMMSLVDSAKLSLSDSIGRFLPNYVGTRRSITVRQLFSHTSGLARTDEAIEDGLITLAQAVDSIARLPIDTLPGAVFAYGGVSMHVAGRIAEIASGVALPSGAAWDSLFARLIAQPLEMRRTDYETVGARFAPTENPRIAGGVRSTVEDYAHYLLMLLNGGIYNGKRVLSKQAIDTMIADQTFGLPIAASPYKNLAAQLSLPEIAGTRYGIGNWREVIDSATGGIQESACQGAFGFSPWIDWRRNTVAVLGVTGINVEVYPTYLRLKTLLRDIIPLTTSSTLFTENFPVRFQLAQNYPNPFNPETAIRYQLSAASDVRLKVFDVLGRAVRTLVNDRQAAGDYSVMFNASGLPSGIYFYRLQAGGYTQTRKMVLLK